MNSFIENVNYVANLDNKYGSRVEIYKNNLSLKSVQHDIELKFSYYNNDDKKIHSIVHLEPGVLVGGIDDTLLSFKTLVESSITGSEFTCTVSSGVQNFVINNIVMVNISIISNNNTYKAYELEMKVVTAGAVTYDVFGEVKDSLKILPSLAMITTSDIDAIVSVYEIQEEVITVSENIANVETVSDSIANVNTVGISISNVNIVGEDIANVNTVSTHISNVDTSATNIANIDIVATSIDNIIIASENISNINTVANAQNLADIIRVADDLNSLDVNGIADITIVANDLILGIDSNIITVSKSIDNVNIAGNDINNINIVGTDIANVEIVSTNIENVNITANDIVSINTVSFNIADVNTVSDGIINVNTVSGSIDNVNTVASNIVGLNSIVSNMTEILLADDNATIAATKASEAVTSADNALASENKAEKWATELEDVPVEPGKYSAMHWALKAEELASGSASSVSYDNSTSVLVANDVQSAIDEIDINIETLSSNVYTKTDINNSLALKVDKVAGKGLSTEDYTTIEKTKLSGIASGAQVNVPTDLSLGTVTATVISLNSSTGTYVNLPSATTSTAGLLSATDKTKLDSIDDNANNYTLPVATSTVKGGVELYSDTVQTVASNVVSTTASRTYGIQLNSVGQAVVNVPWVDTNTVYTHPTTDGSMHVPATGTVNSGKVLTAGATAGSFSWVAPTSGVTDHTLLTNIGTNTHAQIDTALTRLVNISGTNTGDNAVNTNYASDYRAANFIAGTNYQEPIGTITGIAKGNGANSITSATVRVDYAEPTTALATGILKNTTTTGVHSIAVAGTDYLLPNGSAANLTSFPTLNQNTTGNADTATKLQTAITINGVSFDGSANITVSDTTKLPLTGGTMTGAITAIRETKVAMAANNIDLATGNLFTKTISGVTTFTVSNVLASGNVNSFILELTNGGSSLISWFAGAKWSNGTIPVLTAAGIDVLGFYTHDGGVTWKGKVIDKDVK